MADRTGISWTDATWNPTRGCTQVSPGCRNCFAKHQAARIVRMAKGQPSKYDGLVRLTARGEPAWTGRVDLDPGKLAIPLKWRKPRKIFVDSMSDLFHEKLTNEQIAAVFGVMAACPQHTFQVLTKRAKRMREWFEWVTASRGSVPYVHHEVSVCIHAAERLLGPMGATCTWPLPNVWLGVSVENQAAAEERIPEFLRAPAEIRFLSCEPLLGPLNLEQIERDGSWYDEGSHLYDALRGNAYYCDGEHGLGGGPRVDWVIAGCESGPGARPCDAAWLRALRDQCASVGVAYFLKQAVEEGSDVTAQRGSRRKPGGVIELPYLDGVQHAAFPEPP